MRQRSKKKTSGFTLIELAIVLAVAGLLFAGLWRLISGGNQQLRDQAAATEQQQLISAVKGFLTSQAGSNYMTNNSVSGGCGGNCAPNATFSLPLPTTACPGTGGYSDVNLQTFCNFLPAGFSSATTNSYGQIYSIRILRDSTPAGSAPTTYSFMIVTSGGDTIPDTSGGRITSMIGGDGGFIYGTNVCDAAGNSNNNHFACGAYGAWSLDIGAAGSLGGYGFAYPATGGYIASRTYYSASQGSIYPWLARIFMTGDNPNAPVFNTMTTPFYLGGNIFYFGSNNTLATGGGGINMQGGNITGSGTSNISLSGSGGTNPSPVVQITTAGQSGVTEALEPGVAVASGCQKTSLTDTTCQWALQVSFGDVSINGLMQANSMYAGTFFYNTGGGVSDMRLKEDIKPIQHALDNIEKLKPVSFVMKSTGKPSLGVIAQDVEKVYPDLVINMGDGYKAVNYNGLIGPLIKAVQELEKQNQDLRKQIAGQAAREEKLEQKLNERSPQ